MTRAALLAFVMVPFAVGGLTQACASDDDGKAAPVNTPGPGPAEDARLASESAADCQAQGGRLVYSYRTPGCNAAPACFTGLDDACAATYCGCDGKTYGNGCSFAPVPWQYRGPCLEDGGVPECLDDVQRAGAKRWKGDVLGCDVAPVCVVRYESCDANLKVCGCDGKTYPACEYHDVAIAHRGACDGG